MKQGWEYKKLKEVSGFRRGSFPQPYGEPKWYDGENPMPFVQVADMQEDSFDLVPNTKSKISELAQPFSVFVPIGVVLVSLQGSIGKVAITQYDCYVDRTVAIFNQLDESIWDKKFFAYSIKTIFEEKRKLARGISIKTITKEEFSDFECAVPPLTTQQSIVSELDTLSQIIADYKEQLADYDKLEQSIFYDMFGDPVKNEKGWEVKKLGEICEIGTGSTPSRKIEDNYIGDISWVKSTEVCNCYVKETQEHISQKAYDSSNCSIYPKGSVLMAMYGQGKTRGQVAILEIEACTNQAVAAIVPSKEIHTMFLYFQLHLMYNFIRDMANGCNQSNLNLNIVRSINIILPPLPLQQQFASKIESIEQMKADTKAALQDAELLFNARMDYYFNG